MVNASPLVQINIYETYNGLYLLVIEGEDYGSFLSLKDAKEELIEFLKKY